MSKQVIRRLIPAFVAAGLTVAGLEWLATAALDRRPLAHSFDFERNPNEWRGLNDYTAVRARRPDQKLVILIGNSQAFAAELDEPEEARMDESVSVEEFSVETLIEDVSIDGMCGVY